MLTFISSLFKKVLIGVFSKFNTFTFVTPIWEKVQKMYILDFRFIYQITMSSTANYNDFISWTLSNDQSISYVFIFTQNQNLFWIHRIRDKSQKIFWISRRIGTCFFVIKEKSWLSFLRLWFWVKLNPYIMKRALLNTAKMYLYK